MKRWRRWLRRHQPSSGGLVRAFWKVGLVGALFFAAASPAVAFYEKPGLNGIASKLAGRPVEVHCLSQKESQQDPVIGFWGASGYVTGMNDPLTGRWFPNDYATFAYGICEDLVKIEIGKLDGVNFYDAVWSVITITHESGHMKGAAWAGDEAKTQCWALRHLRSTLNQLGVRDSSVQSFYIRVALDIQKQMPDAYQPKSCRYPVP